MPTVTRAEKLDLRLTPSAKRVLQSAATAARRSGTAHIASDVEVANTFW